MKSWKAYHYTRALVVAVVMLIVVYWPAMNTEFLLDDWAQIVENPLVHSIEYLPQLFLGSTFYSGGDQVLSGLYYRPLMMTMFSLIYSLSGPVSTPFHFFQLAVHILNMIAVFGFLAIIINRRIALLSALVFAFHPINQEAVAYISNMQDVLLSFFGICSLLVLFSTHKRVRLLPKFFKIILLKIADMKPSLRIRLSLGFVLLALLTKEAGVIFFVAGLSWLWMIKESWLRQYGMEGSLVLLVFALLRHSAIGGLNSDPVIPIANASLWERLLSWPSILWDYISTFIYPDILVISKHFVVSSPSFSTVYLPLLLVVLFSIGLISGIVYVYKTGTERAGLSVLVTMLVLNTAIISQIIPLTATVAYRWWYISSIAICGILGMIFYKISLKNMVFSRYMPVLISILIVTLGYRTYTRNLDWSSALSLYSVDYAHAGEHFLLDNNLGLEWYKLGDHDKALYHFERSIELMPSWGASWNNLGLVLEAKYEREKDELLVERAFDAYMTAIEFPTGSAPWINASRLVSERQIKDVDSNRVFLRNAVRQFPLQPELWYLLSRFEYDQNELDEAIFAAQKFAHLVPDHESRDWLMTVNKRLDEIK